MSLCWPSRNVPISRLADRARVEYRSIFIDEDFSIVKDQTRIIPLVILDVQDAIDRPNWNDKSHPSFVVAIQRLLEHWRSKSWPVIHIKHDEKTPTSSYYVDGPWNGIKKEVAPVIGESLVIKSQNCAFINTDLNAILKGMDTDYFVLTGVVIHHSMDATVRAGKALGYKIILPSDATTAVPVKSADGGYWSADTVHSLTLAILNGEYAEVMSSEELLNKLP